MYETKRINGRIRCGFTLVEVLIVLLILSILVIIGTPGLLEAIRANRTLTQADTLHITLEEARDAALLHGHTIALCASSDGETCASSTDWSVGWLVTDLNNGAVLAIESALRGGSYLLADVKTLTFAANGEPDEAATFVLGPDVCVGRSARTIGVELTGLVSNQARAC
jgi:type IV fimbrial biogenesis protein FimT